MTSILKVDTIQTAAGGAPTIVDLGINYESFDNYKLNQIVRSTNISSGFSSVLSTWFTVGSLLITPVSVNSVILISANMQVSLGVSGSLNSSIWYGESELFRFSEINAAGRYGSSGSFVHIPGVTTQITYSIRWLKESGADAVNGTINGTNGNNLFVREYVPV